MDFSLTTLFVLPSGTLAPDNFKRENLHPTQFGIFNSRYKAVTSATDAAKSPYIVFGQGRIENVPSLTHKYSDKVSQKSLIEWYPVRGNSVSKSQITYVGFDGVDTTKTLKAGCDEQVSLTIRGFSEYINTAFANGLTRTVTITTPCCEDCGDDCASVDPRWIANALAAKALEDTWISKYYTVTPVLSCSPAVDQTTAATVTYSVTVTDAGTPQDLAFIQSQYPNVDISVGSRAGLLTTYTFTQLASASAPAVVSLTAPIALAVCDVCPSTYTLQEEQEVYLVKRPLAGTEDLSTAGARQTYANTIKTAYVAGQTFNGATAVDPTTNQITIPTHGRAVGDAVVYSNGGGTTIVGLTNGNTYYIQSVPDANNVTLSATKGGAVVDITADGVGASHSLTSQATATFLNIVDGSAVVELKIEAGNATLTAVAADIVDQLDNLEAVCIPPVGSTVAWTATGTGLEVARTLRITVSNDCATDLASVQAEYPNYTVTLVTSANCNSEYQLTQFSDSISDTCGMETVPTYADVQPYKGIEWTVFTTVQDPAPVCSAGIRIEGKPLDKYGNPCDPVAFPFEYDKLRFDVFAYKGAETSQDFLTYNRCDNFPVTTTQRSSYPSGSGAEIKALEIRYHSYQTTHKHIFHNPTWNGGFVQYADESKFYDTYYIKFASPDLNTWDNVSRQDESVIIAVPAGQGQALEQFLLGYFGAPNFNAGVL